MDVEEYVRRHVAAGEDDKFITNILIDKLSEFKKSSQSFKHAFSHAVLEEVKNAQGLTGDFFSYEPASVKMGEFGVGSRGKGDFFAHREIARIIGKTQAAVGVDEMDDAGAVKACGEYIVCTVDGMHSRLSDYPFLAGFHVTRATLRDLYVMGATPLMLFSDIHVADDGDVAKIFDYTAGITTVGEMMDVPLVTGSTLRIGGDMVLGERLTGCVGAVGISHHLTARKSTRPDDVLLMTEGAGGGTIATAAIYSGYPDVVEETINLNFLTTCKALIQSQVFDSIHAMTDVTNGGLRGDIFEMAETANCRMVVREEDARSLVNPKVGKMLDDLEIDYLGVSLDALLIVAPESSADEIIQVIRSTGVNCREIGFVEKGTASSVLVKDGVDGDFQPRFRESAYTPVKKVVDNEIPDFEEMKKGVLRASYAASAKKERVLKRLKSKKSESNN